MYSTTGAGAAKQLVLRPLKGWCGALHHSSCRCDRSREATVRYARLERVLPTPREVVRRSSPRVLVLTTLRDVM